MVACETITSQLEESETILRDLGLVPATDDAIQDGRLRREALPFRELDDSVVLNPKGHEGRSTVCHVCGSGSWTITHCGRPLCLPCQRKRASRSYPHIHKAIIAGQAHMDRLHESTNITYGYRFVTVTLKSVPVGQLSKGVRRAKEAWQKLRRSAFWTDQCAVLGDIPRLEVTYNPKHGWHVHIHSIVASTFMPSGKKYGATNLTDAWHAVTGDSMIVDVRSVDDSASLTRELVKYVFKPTDELGAVLDEWPDGVRRELAEVLAGPYRMAWFCPVHHARTRAECLAIEREQEDARLAGAGIHAETCEGEYRRERQGFRPLVPSGVFHATKTRFELLDGTGWYEVMGVVKPRWDHVPYSPGSWYVKVHDSRVGFIAESKMKSDKPSCHQCGLGQVRDRRWWEKTETFYDDGFQNAGTALKFIHAHEMTERHGRNPLDLHYCMPSGWIPPPEYADFVPNVRHIIVDMVREWAQDFDGLLDRWTFGFEQSRVLRTGLKSLVNLGVLECEYGTEIYRVNEPLLARLTGASS